MTEFAPETETAGLIGLFSHHPVAANLLMVMMLLAGVWGVRQLNTQFFPSFELKIVIVNVAWSGASADDVGELIATPMEQALRDIDHVLAITSVSREGSANISVQFKAKVDLEEVLEKVKEHVEAASLPEAADPPTISTIPQYEDVAKFLIAGRDEVSDLRSLARRFESELHQRGINKILIDGLPREKIAIEISSMRLRELGLSLDDIGRRVIAWSRDAPIGLIGLQETSRQLRFAERREDQIAFASVPIVTERNGRLLSLSDIADIRRVSIEGATSVRYAGKPAIEFSLKQIEGGDNLEAAKIFREWLADTRPTLPHGVELIAYNQNWELLQGRIWLLIKNGFGGLILVICVLFLFMNARVAFWVATGIPVSFMASLAALYFAGGSINMISLFAMIMALGIIVDDTIVVGENAIVEYDRSDVTHAEASERAAARMIAPVFSSSLTTIAAFLPLLLIGGAMGSILKTIPVVVICVIIASLIECFLILPGHLSHSFHTSTKRKPTEFRKRMDAAFGHFRDDIFRRAVILLLEYRGTVLAAALTMLLITVAWVMGGRIGFQFFPTAEADRIYANVAFVVGTPAGPVKEYIELAEEKLREVERELGEDFIRVVISRHAGSDSDLGTSSGGGEHIGAVSVELIDPDKRRTRNHDIIRAWREKLPRWPGLESLSIAEPRAGPPGQDLNIAVNGGDIYRVKQAALALQDALRGFDGVSNIGDNAPYGREQMVLRLTPTAKALGLSIDDVSRQLRAAYDGFQVHELSDGSDNVDVVLQLPQHERNTVASLSSLEIILPSGVSQPLSNLADVHVTRGFETILHTNGKLGVNVNAAVDPTVANMGEVIGKLWFEVMPRLNSQYGVQFDFGSGRADEADTLTDLKVGLMIALVMIYLVLAWVFGSYTWPILVMAIIPFGLIGAIWGHVLMGQDITLLSLFGFFGLSGIVVNDSIILVMFYKYLRQQGEHVHGAVIKAACGRLRPVILTSLTTVAGLLPLLFEKSLQAQFLIPMATSIAFGLAFATLLILFLLPSMLMMYEKARATALVKARARARTNAKARAAARRRVNIQT